MVFIVIIFYGRTFCFGRKRKWEKYGRISFTYTFSGFFFSHKYNHTVSNLKLLLDIHFQLAYWYAYKL